MTLLSIIFYTVGFCAVAWWLFGTLLLAFAIQIYVANGAPLSTKLITWFVSGWVLPWLLITVGRLPMAMITKRDMTPEDEADLRRWMEEHGQ
jgi:hypothetical protein